MPCPDIEICKTYVSEAKFIHQCKGTEKFEDCLSYIWRRNPESKTPKEWSEQQRNTTF